MDHFIPKEIVAELDRYIVGQADAKRARDLWTMAWAHAASAAVSSDRRRLDSARGASIGVT